MTGYFNSFLDKIDPNFWRDLCIAEGELLHYNKGEEFFKAGFPAKYLGYIKSGRLKYLAFGEDGTEHVVGLEFAGEFVADFPFSLSRRKARVTVVAESDSEIYCVEAKRVMEMMADDPVIKEMVMKSTEAVFDMVYDRYVDLYTKTAKERYDDMMSRHPDLFALFSLKDIASFLNITPTHLSRLRRCKSVN